LIVFYKLSVHAILISRKLITFGIVLGTHQSILRRCSVSLRSTTLGAELAELQFKMAELQFPRSADSGSGLHPWQRWLCQLRIPGNQFSLLLLHIWRSESRCWIGHFRSRR
uniref:Uncharacterized protein n=1 Tax=Aegilops tauschii subsp. strangulata TaxID=200361 RepID=A0A453JFA2_AEGTS